MDNMAIHFNHIVQTSEITYLPTGELSTLSKEIKREIFSRGEEEKEGERITNRSGRPSIRIGKRRNPGKRGGPNLGRCSDQVT
jgi:hypothetical protein